MADETYTYKQFFKDYWILLGKHRREFIFFTILRAISSFAIFGVAYCVGMIIDFFVKYQKGQPLIQFYILVAIIAILGVIEVYLRFYAKFKMQTIAAEIRKEARVNALNKLIDLDIEWHDKQQTGQKIEKINAGSEKIYDGLDIFSNQGIEIIVGLIGGIFIFLALDWKYAVYGLVYAAIYLSMEFHFNKKIEAYELEFSKSREKITGSMYDSNSNILTVKSLGLKQRFQTLSKKNEDAYFNNWRNKKQAAQNRTKLIKAFSAIGYAGFIFLLGSDIITGLITIGSIMVFSTYFLKLTRSLFAITETTPRIIEVKTGIRRFLTISGLDVQDRESDEFAQIPKDWSTIEFKDVYFKYKNRWVLKRFNLKINRNDKIGIVGKSGCGKSTLAKLLLGIYKANKGMIAIDGKDINQYKQSSITNTISIVLQDSEMFNMNLKDNIAISSARNENGHLKDVISIACLQKFLARLPHGLNTIIGEKGHKVSGGERQRIGIARALYKDSPVLLLDEATSHLDSRTERVIQSRIEKLEDKTLIIIAHRLSTLKNTSKIIVIETGRIKEQGSFRELLKKKGKFYQMYRLQTPKSS